MNLALQKINICLNNPLSKTLLEEYNIKTVTVHDAIYMKINDIEYLNKNNISIQKLFNTLLTTNKFI